MDEKTKAFYDAAAKRTIKIGPYYAIGIIQAACENTEETATAKIENISYFLNCLLQEQEKEA